MELKRDIIQAIGNTPLVRLNKVTNGIKSEIYAKCEFLNPGGSVKDRIGYWIIEDAEKLGLLKPGGTIVEATSGNTGMGLAIAAAVKGYKCVFVLPDKMSLEKIKNLRAFGAKVVVTPTAVAPDDPRSYYSVSRRIAQETPNSFYANQYHNLANREAHYQTTGPEIWRQTDGTVDVFVAGMGTGGTISGAAKFLKETNPAIKVVGVDPIGSILHDYFKTGKTGKALSYKIEGIGEDILPENLDFKLLDEVVQVSDKEAFQMTRKLLTQEGIFCGVSAGAAVVGAVKYARTLKEPKRIVVIVPDSGDRYLSKVFDDDWMREAGFLEDTLGTVRDLVASMPAQAILSASPEDAVGRVIDVMRDKGVSQLPVMRGSDLLGLVAENDLLSALYLGKLKNTDPIGSIVENNFARVSFDDSLEKVSQAMTGGLIPIVVEASAVKAILSKIDFISYLAKRK